MNRTTLNTPHTFHTVLILSIQNTLVAGIPFWLQRKLFAWLVKRGHKRNAHKGTKNTWVNHCNNIMTSTSNGM